MRSRCREECGRDNRAPLQVFGCAVVEETALSSCADAGVHDGGQERDRDQSQLENPVRGRGQFPRKDRNGDDSDKLHRPGTKPVQGRVTHEAFERPNGRNQRRGLGGEDAIGLRVHVSPRVTFPLRASDSSPSLPAQRRREPAGTCSGGAEDRTEQLVRRLDAARSRLRHGRGPLSPDDGGQHGNASEWVSWPEHYATTTSSISTPAKRCFRYFRQPATRFRQATRNRASTPSSVTPRSST